jgi:Fe-S cluster assembly iron-binding protein IscA
MNKHILFAIWITLVFSSSAMSQNKPGIHFQGIARSKEGLIVANKQMNIKIGLYKDSVEDGLVYEEIKSIKTNVLGVFFVNIGKEEEGKIFTKISWDKIKWEDELVFIKVEIDPENDLQFLSLGFHPINASPYALHSYSVNATNIRGTIPISQGGTGTTNLKDLQILLGIDKINNTPDSVKPITKNTLALINQKLNSVDTIALSSRVNLKLSKTDTISLSNRVNQKLNKSDTIYLSNRIEKLSQAMPSPKEWGCFYDTSRQSTTANTATAVQWNFAAASNTATITNNTAGLPTRVSIQSEGTYKVFYKIQMLKQDIGNDELSIWIRKNSAAYPFSHQSFTVYGGSIKNSFIGNYYLDLGDRDYIEVFYSVKNTNSKIMSNPTSNNPSRPSTPGAYLIIEKIN